ncbi:proteinase-activated receptor 1-like [Strongylocentrotus purpuratus]|uniref:G-protein coupled receptors family 1 profile domain-containing protein n=1 Tax=Strongylocentrotus purpuratus TaxID=7668 RepID=A0A7M7PBM0_STRPU|nr:proteinase-activated receptor 1-like [Strongylocentrotus purpuratus]
MHNNVLQITVRTTSYAVKTGLKVIFHCAILVSVLSVLAVACYRFIAIAFDPFGSRNLVTTPRCIVGSVLMWVLLVVPMLVLKYCSSVYDTFLLLINPIIMFTSLAITAFCYIMTYKDISGAGRDAGGLDQIKSRLKENRKVLATFAVITLTSCVCWIVHCFHDILQIYSIYYENIDAVSNILVALNFVIDPVIYWWRLEEFRAVLYKMVCRSGLARRIRRIQGKVEDSSTSTSGKIFSVSDTTRVMNMSIESDA